MPRPPIAIIGVGNYLMCDEGVGIHAVSALRELDWPEDVEIIDGGTPGVALLHLIEGRELAIIIDCADFGGNPGEIKTFDPDKLQRDDHAEISLHATDLLSALALARTTGNYPKKIVIVGIQPKEIKMGTKLSEQGRDAIEKLPMTIQELLANQNRP